MTVCDALISAADLLLTRHIIYVTEWLTRWYCNTRNLFLYKEKNNFCITFVEFTTGENKKALKIPGVNTVRFVYYPDNFLGTGHILIPGINVVKKYTHLIQLS